MDIFTKTMRTNEKMVFVADDHFSPSIEREILKPGELCSISFSSPVRKQLFFDVRRLVGESSLQNSGKPVEVKLN